MSNWDEIYQYLQPKPPLYCPETPSIRQKVFLRTNQREVLFGGSAGGGKLLELLTPVPTPSGWVPIKDIHPGDIVFGRDGKPHLVEAESEIVNDDAWKLTFDDGSSIVAHDDHLWLTFDAKELAALTRRDPEWRAKRREQRASRTQANPKNAGVQTLVLERNKTNNPSKPQPPPEGTVRTTAEIVATLTVRNGRRANHAVPVAAPLQLPHRDLPVDPYLLGCWLGDGSTGSGQITGMDQEIHDAFAATYELGSTHQKPNNKSWQTHYLGLRTDLQHLGVLGNKHIPHDYLWASEEQRLALLQGLMDTDGNVAGNSVEFANTNRDLVEGVAHLLRSLGMKATVREFRTKLNGKDCGPGWRIKTAVNRIVFQLPRKAETQQISTRRTTQFRYIKTAERIRDVEMKCIRVSSPDHLYLAGDHMIPTHNSSALLMAALQYVDVPNYSAILFSRTYADLALPGRLMDRFLMWVRDFKDVRWDGNKFSAVFPSGARVTFGYLNNKDDYTRYKCLTPDHEVLTEDGWVPISKVQVGDSIASLDPETRAMSFHPAVRTFEYDYSGEMITTRAGSDVSFVATPNHTVWSSTQKNPMLKAAQAKDLPQRPFIPQTATWEGAVEAPTMEFPATRGKPLSFSGGDFAEFLGWFITEGWAGAAGGKWEISIAQTEKYPENRKRIVEVLERAGANPHVSAEKISFNNKALCQWLNANVGSGSKYKRIPRMVLGWDVGDRLLDALIEGDGTWRSDSSAVFVTTSPVLADNVSELAVRQGYRATMLEQSYSEKHHFLPEGKYYHVALLKKESDTATYVERVDYTGKVYSLEVAPHHTYMVRHNGRVSWTGNSAEFQYVGMDEVTDIREFDYRYMFSRLRRPKGGELGQVPLRMRAASNPAPNWVRQRFIVEGAAEGRIFIPSFLTDNPGIDADSYREMLSQLDPIERRRLEHGDWWASGTGSLFSKEDFVIIDSEEIPTLGKPEYVRYWDLAGTEITKEDEKLGRDADWTVGTLMMLDKGVYYVLDQKRARFDPAGVERLVADTAAEDGGEVAIRIEQEPGSSGKALGSHYARNVLAGYEFDYKRVTGDKITRAKPYSAAVRNGNVRLLRSAWNSRFLDEHTSFPEETSKEGMHDDQVDSASGAFSFLAKLDEGTRRRIEIIV